MSGVHILRLAAMLHRVNYSTNVLFPANDAILAVYLNMLPEVAANLGTAEFHYVSDPDFGGAEGLELSYGTDLFPVFVKTGMDVRPRTWPDCHDFPPQAFASPLNGQCGRPLRRQGTDEDMVAQTAYRFAGSDKSGRLVLEPDA